MKAYHQQNKLNTVCYKYLTAIPVVVFMSKVKHDSS